MSRKSRHRKGVHKKRGEKNMMVKLRALEDFMQSPEMKEWRERTEEWANHAMYSESLLLPKKEEK